MDKNDIYDYDNYKEYLLSDIHRRPGRGHGFRSRMAEAAGCRVAFISQVLNGNLQLNMEQAEAINQLLGHSSDESDFFLLLVQYGRAGTHHLRNRLKSQIDKLRQKRLVLKDRVDIKTSLDLVAQTTYYSSWHYAAVHILTSIAGYQTKEAVAGYLRLPVKKVSDVLDFLCSVGLVRVEAGQFKLGVARIFLGNDSPMILRHHSNWRMRAIESLDRNLESDVHLSTIMSFSKKDLLRLKEQVIKGIEQTRSQARDSVPEEEIYCFCVDFFRL
ncbi:MAG: hypothetical protein A3K03_04660 [Bdellovibrionales bacterium RIFOXYD1_FULL_44_7]|nr:MAG: hypothetical protein A3K03_04660 [Bdellovibrionales bacterium RIFOXYD1_FULL_44_7]